MGALVAALLSVSPHLGLADGMNHGFRPSHLTLLASADGVVGCAKDTDCKGERICVEGKCQDPAPASTSSAVNAPPPPPPPPPSATEPPRAPLSSPSATEHLQAPRPPDLSFQLMDINRQIQALEESRPSTGGPVALTVIGGVALVPGFLIFWFVNWPSGLVMMIAGGIALTIGIVLYVSHSNEARSVDERIQHLEDERRELMRTSGFSNPALIRVAEF